MRIRSSLASAILIVIYDLSTKEFSTSLYYVAVLRIKTLEELIINMPFPYSKVFYDPLVTGIRNKITDCEAR